MFNLGPGEIVVVLILALLVLGPKRLPELARGIGKFMREFRRQTDDVRSMVEREFYKMDQEISTPLLPDGSKPQTPPDAVAANAPPEEPFPGYPDHAGENPPEVLADGTQAPPTTPNGSELPPDPATTPVASAQDVSPVTPPSTPPTTEKV